MASRSGAGSGTDLPPRACARPAAGAGRRLSRAARVRTAVQFRRVLTSGRALRGGCFRLHYHPAHGHGAVARLGLTVSRRVDKRAVGRNRIKRQGRERFRHWRAALPAGDYVLVAGTHAATVANPALREDLDRLFAQVSALKPSSAAGTMPPCPPHAPANSLPN